MRKYLAAILVLFFSVSHVPSSFAGTVADLAGKWSSTRTNEDGKTATLVLEIKKDRFIFRILDEEKKTGLFARGTVKVETVGSINIATFIIMESGKDETDTATTDDTRQVVYALDGDTLTLALEFDKNRGQKPRIDTMTKEKP